MNRLRAVIRRAGAAVRQAVRDLPIRSLLIIAFSALAFIPALSIALLSSRRSQTVIAGALSQYSLGVLNELSRIIEYRIDEVNQLSYILFPNLDVQQTLQSANRGYHDEYTRITQARKIQRLLLNAFVGRSDIDAVWLLSSSGELFAASVGLERPEFMFTEDERRLLDDRRGSVAWLTPRPDRLVIPIARAVNDLNTIKPIGYLVIDVLESSLFGLYADLRDRIRRELDGELFIVTRDGRIVSHADKSLIGRGLPAGPLASLPGRTGSGVEVGSLAGRTSYLYYKTLRGPGCKIVGVVPAIQYRKEIVAVRNSILLLALGVLAVSVLLAYVLSKGISGPILSLTHAMQRAGQGQFSFEPLYRSRSEVGILHERFATMLREIDELIRTVYREELALREAELKSLRMQINPHFLYNTLESINWLARTRGVPEIGIMAKALGDLMRSSISGGDCIPLGEEIDIVRNYLAIQQFRYRDRFDVEFSVGDALTALPVPKLILQPLVENAIVHGIEPKKGRGRIAIRASTADGKLLLEVTDDGMGLDAGVLARILDEPPAGARATTIGLRNVHQRVRMRYGNAFGVTVESRPNGGTRVTIVLPDPAPADTSPPASS